MSTFLNDFEEDTSDDSAEETETNTINEDENTEENKLNAKTWGAAAMFEKTTKLQFKNNYIPQKKEKPPPTKAKDKIGTAFGLPSAFSEPLRPETKTFVEEGKITKEPIKPEAPKVEKRKVDSTIKEKERHKRMRGQSSHATWKSEEWMKLRQQFD